MTVAVAVPPAAGNGIASTVEKDDAAPPPNTKARPPSTAPAASWVAVVNDPAVVAVPAGTPMVDTLDVDTSPVVKPPRTTTLPEPEPGTTTSRLSGWASVHGRTPDSTAGGPLPAAVPAPVVAGADATASLFVPCCLPVAAAVDVVVEASLPGPGARADVHHDEHDHHDRQDAPDDDGATPALEGSPAALRDVLARGSGSAHGRVQLGRSHRGRARTLPGDPSRPPQRPDRPQSTARPEVREWESPWGVQSRNPALLSILRFSDRRLHAGDHSCAGTKEDRGGPGSCLFERTYAP